MKEPEIIKGCKREKQSAQKALYELYLPYIIGICRRFNIPDSDLKDAIQEIFIETFLSIKKYDARKAQFKFWIKAVAIHKILKIQRSNRMPLIVELDNQNNRLTADNLFLKNLDQEYLTQLITTLPDGYRTVFNLYVIDGYSHKEIGKLLEISEASSRSQLSRAKKLLQEKLRQLKNKKKYESI